MLKNLFGGSGPAARPPDGERLYAIGDIHGCSEILDRLMDAIRDDEAKAGKPGRLIFLGDYVDRGPDSYGVIERLIAIERERKQSVFLKGNHEAALLDFLTDPEDNPDWLHWGGAETLESYGVNNPWGREPEDLAEELKKNLPPEHLTFMQRLELTRTFGDYLFVHAGLRPGIPLEAQEEQDLLWIRSVFHNMPADARPDKVVVHGHQPMKKPKDAGWRIGVDTGACFSGQLTAVVLEEDSRRFIST